MIFHGKTEPSRNAQGVGQALDLLILSQWFCFSFALLTASAGSLLGREWSTWLFLSSLVWSALGFHAWFIRESYRPSLEKIESLEKAVQRDLEG